MCECTTVETGSYAIFGGIHLLNVAQNAISSSLTMEFETKPAEESSREETRTVEAEAVEPTPVAPEPMSPEPTRPGPAKPEPTPVVERTPEPEPVVEEDTSVRRAKESNKQRIGLLVGLALSGAAVWATIRWWERAEVA